jgi:serine/threonine-protein kinase
MLELQRTSPAPRPRSIRPDVNQQAEAIVLRLLEKDVRKRFQDAHHLQEELKTLQRSLPSQTWEVGSAVAEAPAAPPPPPPQSAGVVEWAGRAALFSRMIARAYPLGNAPSEFVHAVAQAWDLAARASRLEGEVSTHTRKLEALERRGRALRAEIGRKVEELAHEESRVLREGAAFAEEADKVRLEVSSLERAAAVSRTQADAAERTGQGSRAIFERAGAAEAMLTAKREWLKNREEKRSAREASARDLRRQIEDLRGQLSRYAEALEEDLASGREKVAQRTREGLGFEKSFTDVSDLLVAHLKTKPECRDLLNELLATPGMAPPARTDVVR